MDKRPTFANGKICYLEIPATEAAKASDFYSTVFGWEIIKHEDGAVTFNDSAGEVSGMWVTNRAPGTDNGIMIHIMVYDMDASLKLVTENGG